MMSAIDQTKAERRAPALDINYCILPSERKPETREQSFICTCENFFWRLHVTLNIWTPKLLTILVPSFEQVPITTCSCN